MLQLGASRLAVAPTPRQRAAMVARYRRHHWVRLPSLVEPRLLRTFRAQLRRTKFVQKPASETNCLDMPEGRGLPGLIGLLLGSEPFFDIVREATRCPKPVRGLIGYVARFRDIDAHYVNWHSDMRLLKLPLTDATLLVNLGGPYGGGRTMVRVPGRRGIVRFSLPRAGDAVLFRGSLAHRSERVRGRRPKTLYVGWFSLDDVTPGGYGGH